MGVAGKRLQDAAVEILGPVQIARAVAGDRLVDGLADVGGLRRGRRAIGLGRQFGPRRFPSVMVLKFVTLM
jgi:hypothetical protein